MKVFIITDNVWWFNKSQELFKEKKISLDVYCSPNSTDLFLNEIQSGAIKVFDVKKDYDYLIKNYKVGFSCHCKQIFPKELVDSLRCINIHPGFNPFNRGWYPQVFSILNKKPAGATIHLMDSDIDHGNILCQEIVEILDGDISKDVYDRILNVEYSLLENNFDNIINEKFKGVTMQGEGNYNSIRDYKSLQEIDMDKTVTMSEAIDYLRAMTHPPYMNAYIKDIDGKKVYISLLFEKEK